MSFSFRISTWQGYGGPIFAVAALIAPSVIAASDDPSNVARTLFACGVSMSLASAALALYHRPWVRRCLHLGLFCILLELFYRFAYGGAVSPGLLLSIPETSGRETLELLAGHPILTASLSLVALLAGLALIVSWNATIRIPLRRCAQAGMLALAMLVISLALGAAQPGKPSSAVAEAEAAFPLDIAAAFGAVTGDWIDTRLQASRRAAFKFPNARLADAPAREAAAEVYVVVVGETSRRANWSLFGYPRATTPRLEEISSQLVLFDHVTSNATNTVLSLPLAMTRAAPDSQVIARSQKSIVALLKQAGCETFWISNQEPSLVASNPISEIAFDADHVSFSADMPAGTRDGGFDSNLLTRMDEVLSRLPKGRKAVIFLHMEGSHFGYKDRYPAGFEQFQNGQDAPRLLPARQQRLVDEYDNSVYFTDFIIRAAIDRLAARAGKSALIYFSDHGERLFDNGLSDSEFGHGFPTISREEIEIPFFFWLSNDYRDANPALVHRLKANAHSTAQLHNLFETLVDFTGADYDERGAELSLFSDRFKSPNQLDVLNMQQVRVSLAVTPDTVSARN
jgi:glucan phosphoethanolaminetransferase (alkaline phosphatase superfamily)